MSIDASTLRRCLRQLSDAGCDQLVLESLTPAQALALARAAAGGAAPRAAAATAPTDRPTSRAGEPMAGEAIGRAGAGEAPAAAAVRRPHSAEALAALAVEAAGCVRCRLHASRRTVVFGEGPAAAELVVVGEAPGGEEDRTGRPFVGPAGRLLDLLLMTAGFPREQAYICNVLKCRPPQNRNPLEDEVAACTSAFLVPQLTAIAPRVLLAVGKFAVQSLLRTEESIGRLRGRIHDYRGTPLVVSYHPAFLLRTPHMCRVAWHDYQLVRQVFDEQG